MIHAAAETCQNKYALLEVSREEYGDFFLSVVGLHNCCGWKEVVCQCGSRTGELSREWHATYRRIPGAAIYVLPSWFTVVSSGELEEIARVFRTSRGGWIVTGCVMVPASWSGSVIRDYVWLCDLKICAIWLAEFCVMNWRNIPNRMVLILAMWKYTFYWINVLFPSSTEEEN